MKLFSRVTGVLFAALALTFTAPAAIHAQQAKYVFLFIGDGMAMPQISAAEAFANAISTKGTETSQSAGIKKLGFTQFPAVGFTTTYDAGSLITDSASAGTALATGHKTLNGVINMDVTKTERYTTIAEKAHQKGMKVGIVTTVSLDHATPACFYAKVPSRGNNYDIAVQLTASGFEYFAGGGFLQPTGKDKDKPNVIDLAKQAGYTWINSKTDFQALKPGVAKVLAVNSILQDSQSMPYAIDRATGDLSLADYTKKGIELLDNKKGFFMMVEGGKIDWACHANDAASSIRDTLDFDTAVSEAVAFAAKHPKETLIVVTGDHETGGMAIGFAGTQYTTNLPLILAQRSSFVAFNDKILKPYKAATDKSTASIQDLVPAIRDAFGLDYASLNPIERTQIDQAFQRSMGNQLEKTVKEEEYLLYGGYEPLTIKLTQILNQKAGIGWTSYAHSGVPVATFAQGSGQEFFAGYYDNTDIFRKISRVLGVQ